MNIVTMSDKAYMPYGELFLRTITKSGGKVILYSPDIKKIDGVEVKDISRNRFDNEMQCLKFEFLLNNLNQDSLFSDFDVFFNRRLSNIFDIDFDIAITVRNDYMKRGIGRAYANGGVFFARNCKSAKGFLKYGMMVMKNGGDKDTPEYDKIFKTFESGSNRPKEKTWNRMNLRWWVDQVFLSSVVARYYDKVKKIIKDYRVIDFNGVKVALLNCDKYNHLDYNGGKLSDDVYIYHLKRSGREALNNIIKRVK